MKKNNIILSLIILAVLTRLLPHPPNVAPITGIALFAGNKFDNKWIGFILPLVCMFLSDLFLMISSICLIVSFASSAFLTNLFSNFFLSSYTFLLLSRLFLLDDLDEEDDLFQIFSSLFYTDIDKTPLTYKWN